MRACDAETVILATVDAEREIKIDRQTHAPRRSASVGQDLSAGKVPIDSTVFIANMNDDEILVTILTLALLGAPIATTILPLFLLRLHPASSNPFAPACRLASSLSTATSLLAQSTCASCARTAGGRNSVLIGAALREC